MHSRYFLSRTPSEPRASVIPDASDRQLPVGFADVRSDGPLPADERQRAPFGFAPPEPRFVTELSFRRTPRPRPEPVRAMSQQGDANGGLPVGHASGWRPVDEPAEPQVTDPVPATGAEPARTTPRAEERFEEQVPFYKREITFRRKRADEATRPTEPIEQVDEDARVAETEEPAEPFELAEPEEQRVPFYKRELSLRRRKQVLEHPGSPDEDTVDDESPVLAEPSLPFGFAVPSPGEPVARDHDEADFQPVSDEPVLEPVTATAAAKDDADDTVEETHGAATEADGESLHEETGVVAKADESPDAAHAGVRGFGTDVAAESGAPVEGDAALDELGRPGVASAHDEPEAVGEDDLAEASDELVARAAASDPVVSAVEPFEVPAEAGGDVDFGALEAMHDEFDDEPVPVAGGKRRALRGRGGGRASAPKISAPKGGGRGGRRVVGLKIGASQLAAAVVTRENGEERLLQLARTPLEPGVVVDGEVRDAPALQAALKTFFDENRLPRRDVRIGVASNRIGVRTVDISGIDDEDRFGNAVRFKAHEVLPVSFSESVLDYRVVEERVSVTGEVTKRVLLVVAPKDQVEPFAYACVGAGLRLAGIDLEALGLLRTFVPPQSPGTRLATDTATVVVAIGHESTTLLVAGGGLAEFTRVFDWGGLALQHSISQELDVQLPEAATILHGLSLSGPGRAAIDEDLRHRAIDAVRTRLTPFARELVSSLQFYQSQQSSLGIGEIVITGGASHLEGLADALHQMIGVSVRVGDPLGRLVVSHPVDPAFESAIGSFAVPVGLAIEDGESRTVNLVPDEFRKQRRKKPRALQIALPVAAVVPLAAMGFLFMQASGDVSAQRGSLSDVQAQLDALPEPTRPDIDPALAGVQQQRAAALAQVLGGRLAWDRVFGDLSRVLPANVWLTRMTAQLPAPGVAPVAAAVPNAPAPAPTGVTIEGYTYTVPDVARLLGRLGTLPSLTNVSLASTAQKDVGKRQAVSFTILADIRPNGGAQ